MDKPAVPVVMHHSIGIPNENWIWNHLTCPYEVFENQLIWLKKRGFHTISLSKLYEYKRNGTELPPNPIVMTFDDGYLDNWAFAFPLLRKYGFRATIFVNPEFVDPTDEYRPTLDDVWAGRISLSGLDNSGYLSWLEMKKMEQEDVMDIQSHALTHTWYPKSSKIVDFRHPGDRYIWMTWNEHPDAKPFLQLDDKSFIKYGEPVYESGKSLETRRYYPDSNLRNATVEYVMNNGSIDFFKGDWRHLLNDFVNDYLKEHTLNDRYETEEEYLSRVKYELESSKQAIDIALNKDVKFLCWPGGGKNQNTILIASEVGYLSYTYASIESKNKKSRNIEGEDPSGIARIGTALCRYNTPSQGINVVYQNGIHFLLRLYYFQNKKGFASLCKMILAFASRICKLKILINSRRIYS